MVRNDKQFDAVRMMRLIRDRISKEIDGMTFEEQQAYIRKRLGDKMAARFSAGGRGQEEQQQPPSMQTPKAGFR